MPRCYQMVGVPGSGKSTWIQNQNWAQECVYISTDQYVERYAESVGKTYSAVFNEFMPEAVNLMCQDVIVAREQDRDIIWDQTSTTVKSRLRKFNMLPNYEHIAIVVETPSRIELRRRLDSRPGKEIPNIVIEGMIASFETPTIEEGFKEIWYAQGNF